MSHQAGYIRTWKDDGSEGPQISLDKIGLLPVPQIQSISATSFTLTDDNHGKILDFTAGTAVTVTVPSGLPADFMCGISQGGAGQVTLSASGVTIGEPDSNLSTSGQYVLLSLVAFSANAFRLFGRTAAAA